MSVRRPTSDQQDSPSSGLSRRSSRLSHQSRRSGLLLGSLFRNREWQGKGKEPATGPASTSSHRSNSTDRTDRTGTTDPVSPSSTDSFRPGLNPDQLVNVALNLSKVRRHASTTSPTKHLDERRVQSTGTVHETTETRIECSEATQTRVNKARTHFELAQQYRRLLECLPDERQYNPLKALRDRQTRVEKQDHHPSPASFQDVAQVTTFVDNVELLAERRLYRNVHDLLLLPRLPEASTTLPRDKGWNVSPMDMFANLVWAETRHEPPVTARPRSTTTPVVKKSLWPHRERKTRLFRGRDGRSTGSSRSSSRESERAPASPRSRQLSISSNLVSSPDMTPHSPALGHSRNRSTSISQVLESAVPKPHKSTSTSTRDFAHVESRSSLESDHGEPRSRPGNIGRRVSSRIGGFLKGDRDRPDRERELNKIHETGNQSAQNLFEPGELDTTRQPSHDDTEQEQEQEPEEYHPPRTSYMCHAQALFQTAGIKAREILRRSAQSRTDHVKTTLADISTDLDKHKDLLKVYDGTAADERRRITDVRDQGTHLTDETLAQMEKADTLIGDINTRQTLAIKQLHDSMDDLMSLRTREFRWVKRLGYAMLERLVLGIIWIVWIVVIALKTVRFVVSGVVGSVRWLVSI